jgi:Holliday junction DNA helicase RuvA
VIGSLRGTVLERSGDGEVLVEVAGVGYRVVVTPATLSALAAGAQAFFHVHHHIREDAQVLYGFATRDERSCFEALLGAHRVGPALALAILATHRPVDLHRVVAEGDVAALCLVPGVGKQTAARLLLELRARFDATQAPVPVPGGPVDSSPTQAVSEALAGLGYTPEEIREALRSIDGEPDTAALLRNALRVLAARHA